MLVSAIEETREFAKGKWFGMTNDVPPVFREKLASLMCDPAVYPDRFDSPVEVHQTHISWVFLAGDHAYKVKKPIKTDFLDYSTLSQRERYCHEELRLDRRFAAGIYLQVVPITWQNGKLCIEGIGDAIEYAVKMRRFPEDALLSARLAKGLVHSEDITQLATSVAAFHASAARSDASQQWGSVESVSDDAEDNLRSLAAANVPHLSRDLAALSQWTTDFAQKYKSRISQRVVDGFIRECHGDMHLANVIQWQGRIMPFDGIEFNERFRWIDVLSDAAFVSMDFTARGHLELGRSFLNAYLETTGDHASLPLVRWYHTYRALVRAKVAAIQIASGGLSDHQRDQQIRDCQEHVDLARRFTEPFKSRLWITHGLSGSGKTRGSEAVVQKFGAIRFRSDMERKRHYGLDPLHRPNSRERSQLYSEQARLATYGRLRQLARTAIMDGFEVIVDATFLEHAQRERFRQLAQSLGADFAIVDFPADEETLRKRIAKRMASNDDASDADIDVLESQLACQEPLTRDEMLDVVDVPMIQSRAQV